MAAAKLFESADFQIFYNKYPKHTHRDEAMNAWRKLSPSAELIATIMKDVETRQWPDVEYVPNAATYLNKRRWLDEIAPSKVIPLKPAGSALQQLKHAQNEAYNLTPEQRAANIQKLRQIVESIKI